MNPMGRVRALGAEEMALLQKVTALSSLSEMVWPGLEGRKRQYWVSEIRARVLPEGRAAASATDEQKMATAAMARAKIDFVIMILLLRVCGEGVLSE